MSKPVVLRVYKGNQLQGVQQFLEQQIVLGRSGEVQVALDGESVSTIHAAIERRDDKYYYVCDLGSESGTFLNGQRVLDAPLDSGDALQVGDYRIEFYVGIPKPRTAASPHDISVVSPPPARGAPIASAPAEEGPAVRATPEAPSVSVATVPPEESSTEESSAEESSAPFEPVDVPPDNAASRIQARKAESRPMIEANGKPNLESLDAAPKISDPSTSERLQPTKAGVELAPPSSSHFSVVDTMAGGTGTGAVHEAKTMATSSSSTPHVKPGRRARSKKSRKTFAAPSRYTDVRDFIKPSKGTVVEVLVAWRERVISCQHFSGQRMVTIGSHPDCDVILPLLTSMGGRSGRRVAKKLPLVRIDGRAVLLLSPEMRGEVTQSHSSATFVELVRQNRMSKSGSAYALPLEQGEMAKIELSDSISVIVRYVSESPKPLVAPFLDMTTAEATGVVLSFVLVGVLWLYMYLYNPPRVLPEDGSDEPLRTAVIILPQATPPPPPKVEPVAQPVSTPPPPRQIVRATPAPKKVEAQTRPRQSKAMSNLTRKNNVGQSVSVAPNRNKSGPRALTSPKQGGAIKVSDKDGAQMQSPKRDVSKSGVFSVFGGGGAQDRSAGETTGVGELAGLADAASGRAGSAFDRAGQGLGSELKDTGRGGSGKAIEGIAGGIGTIGRGGGNTGYGTGGLGNRQGVRIVTGGNEESFSGTIDREAIRRVIMANLRVIRTCYERQLNRNPDLFGKLVLTWEIGEQGRVAGVGVKSNDLGNNEVAQCILARLKTWRFPEPPANQLVEVSYPFLFSN